MHRDGPDNPQSSSIHFKNTEVTIPEPLSAEETAKIISEAYRIVGPRIGSSFVEANNVLTFSGERGQTEFFIDDPYQNDIDQIKLLKPLEDDGISIRTVGKPFVSPRGANTLMITVESLLGYERVSKMTRMPGFSPFDAKSGWEGLTEWYSNVFKSLHDLSSGNKVSFSQDDISHAVTGVSKGYPDV